MHILLFYDERFPYEGLRPTSPQLAMLTEHAVTASADRLSGLLGEGGWDVLVSLHGPYFPKEAWAAVKRFLQDGGGLVNAGGMPLRRPVVRDGQGWRTEREQTAYHRELDIHDGLAVDVSRVRRMAASPERPVLAGRESLFGILPTWGLTLHPSKSSDIPAEMGSSGPMDAFIYPLLAGVDEDGRERSAPVVLLEQLKGDYAGGRWIFVNQPADEAFWEGGGAEALRELAEYAARGVTEIWLKPNYASYRPGEQAQLTLQLQSLSRTGAATRTWRFELEMRKDGEPEAGWTAALTIDAHARGYDLLLEQLEVPIPLEPGLYRIECRAESDAGEMLRLPQAFWCMDRALLASGAPLAAGRDYFTRGGKPFPVVGMTYMSSDVARKFLQLPNVARWERDMREMKRAGINLIRTGIWTAHRQVMFADGHASEEAMRSIDAFLLTAKRHELEVTFTFFTFAPESWEGVNPYLDPRAVEAQKRFVAAIVSRHQGTANVHWDLINEPSLFNPKRVFGGPQPLGDRFERHRWAEWLRERHGGGIAGLQERWNMTPEQLPSFESAVLPDPNDTYFESVIHPKQWLRWLDYSLFTMEMHNRWAAELGGVIRRNDPSQLLTVGQDEAQAGQRPSPAFYEPVVDYTTVHSWWMNDQLVWDGVFAKTPNKPNLIQETGIMHIQRPDGRAKRSEAELHAMLERKYAYAFSTGGAGAVQWIWNINYFMDNANESNIGALRADGTQKPEADVSYDFGRFIGRIGGLFEERALEEIAVVYPYSNDFSNNKLAVASTSKAVRVLAYGLNAHPRGIGEYQLGELFAQPARLIIVPSAHNFSDEAFARLRELAEQGCTVLWTGPLRLDAYWGEAPGRFAEQLWETEPGNVRREELLALGGERYPVSFGEKKIGTLAVDRPAAEDGALAVRTLTLGRGKWIWCPLPVELNDRWEPIIALYAAAMREAGVQEELRWLAGGELAGVYGRKLSFREGSLYIFVSETGLDAEVKVQDPETGRTYGFTLEKERTVMFAADRQGELTAVYRPGEVQVEAWTEQEAAPPA